MLDEHHILFLVEGLSDSIFIEQVIQAKLEAQGIHVQVLHYAKTANDYPCKGKGRLIHNMTKEMMDELKKDIRELNSYIKSYKMYVLLMDKDDGKTNERVEKYRSLFPHLDPARVAIAVVEIEGWYMAGLDTKRYPSFQGRNANSTTKEDFHNMMTKEFGIKKFEGYEETRLRKKLLHNYDLNGALLRSQSFNNFWNLVCALSNIRCPSTLGGY